MSQMTEHGLSRPPVNEAEDQLVLLSSEAFFEDRRCMFCGCDVFGERPDGRGHVVHDSVLAAGPDGSPVMVALRCVACRPGEVATCWQRPGWDEV